MTFSKEIDKDLHWQHEKKNCSNENFTLYIAHIREKWSLNQILIISNAWARSQFASRSHFFVCARDAVFAARSILKYHRISQFDETHTHKHFAGGCEIPALKGINLRRCVCVFFFWLLHSRVWASESWHMKSNNFFFASAFCEVIYVIRAPAIDCVCVRFPDVPREWARIHDAIYTIYAMYGLCLCLVTGNYMRKMGYTTSWQRLYSIQCSTNVDWAHNLYILRRNKSYIANPRLNADDSFIQGDVMMWGLDSRLECGFSVFLLLVMMSTSFK